MEDPSSAQKMANSMEMTERPCDVKTGCVLVRIYAPQAYDEVIGFECLRGIDRRGSEPLDVRKQVHEQVEFWLVEPLCRPQRSRCEEVEHTILQPFLW